MCPSAKLSALNCGPKAIASMLSRRMSEAVFTLSLRFRIARSKRKQQVCANSVIGQIGVGLGEHSIDARRGHRADCHLARRLTRTSGKRLIGSNSNLLCAISKNNSNCSVLSLSVHRTKNIMRKVSKFSVLSYDEHWDTTDVE